MCGPTHTSSKIPLSAQTAAHTRERDYPDWEFNRPTAVVTLELQIAGRRGERLDWVDYDQPHRAAVGHDESFARRAA